MDNIHEPDVILDHVIQNFMDGEFYFGSATTIVQWRLENYEMLRQWAYPPTADFNDAMVKINSGDSVLITEGNDQLARYYAACLSVKARFLKS